MQDYADLARQGDLGPFHPTPFGDIHSPALQRRETRDARQEDIGRFIERGAHHLVADAVMPPVTSVSPDWYFFGVNPNKAPTALDFPIRVGSSTPS